MKIRPTLTILVVLITGVWLLSHFEGSGAAGLETTMMQELEVAGQAGGEMTAVAPATPFANDSWIRTYPLEEQQFLNDFLLTSNGTALLLEGRWLMKVYEQGEVVWRHRYTDIAYGTLAAIAETIDGYVL
jgi:hypothetical protein